MPVAHGTDHASLSAPSPVSVERNGDPSRRSDIPVWSILEAIAKGDVHPHYQPIVSLDSGRLLGVEALARWRRPEVGAVLPATLFVPHLERARRVTDLTAYMLDRACLDLARWRSSFDLDPAFRVSVNVSATELIDRRLVCLVEETLDLHGVEASALCLEITETAAIEDPDCATRVLAELATEVGVRLAIDDYGTGFATGHHLASFPFDTLKIDQVFVGCMDARAEIADFVRQTIGYATGRAIGVVAEGVETPGQAAALLEVGCTAGQGFGIAVPRPADVVLDRWFGAPLATA